MTSTELNGKIHPFHQTNTLPLLRSKRREKAAAMKNQTMAYENIDAHLADFIAEEENQVSET